MILYELILWFWEHRGDISFLMVAGFLIRHGTPFLLKRLGLDELWHNLRWVTERVEVLMGEVYVSPTEKYAKQARMSLTRYLKLLRAVRRRGITRSRKNHMRLNGGRRMQINKAWLSGIIAYYIGMLAVKYGFKFEVEWADKAAEVIIQFVIPAIIAYVNRHKQKPTDTRTEPFQGYQQIPFDGSKSN